jgi:hypothetical protein
MVPGATVPKMRLATALLGVARAWSAMTSASLSEATEPCLRTIQLHTFTRRSIGAIRPSLLPRSRRLFSIRRTGYGNGRLPAYGVIAIASG